MAEDQVASRRKVRKPNPFFSLKSNSQTVARKGSHVDVCLSEHVEGRLKSTGFEEIDFVNNSLPELDFADIDAATQLLGKKLRAPFIIEAMTGGYPKGGEINKALAAAAQEHGIAMGLGSQRAMIENRLLAPTYRVRDVAPDILLIGNIGAAQLRKYSSVQIAAAVEAVEADALAVHLNAAQELMQPEGDRNFAGILKSIEKLCDEIPVSIIAKETGAGISADAAAKLEAAGVEAIDVSGAGGTSWSGVELVRSGRAWEPFGDWGIPTAVSTALCARAVKIPVICSGGIRCGVRAAKGIALGASAAGGALPFLKAWANGGKDGVSALVGSWTQEFKTTMLLTGCRNLGELRRAPLVIGGKTSAALCANNCFPAEFVSRGK